MGASMTDINLWGASRTRIWVHHGLKLTSKHKIYCSSVVLFDDFLSIFCELVNSIANSFEDALKL